MCCRFYGVMAVYATPDLAFGSVISGFFYSFWNLFAGSYSSCCSVPLMPALRLRCGSLLSVDQDLSTYKSV